MRYVTCGDCGYPIGTHSKKRLDKIYCRNCKTVWNDECDCPDYLYNHELKRSETPLPGEIKKHRLEAKRELKGR